MLQIISAALIVLVSSAAFAKPCVANPALTQAGFVVHSESEFSRSEALVLNTLTAEKADFIFDMQSRMMSKASDRPVEVNSYDRVSTPQAVMYGDVLVVLDLRSGKNTEVRWFDGTKKHVAYNPEFQSCAMEFVPWATNVIF